MHSAGHTKSYTHGEDEKMSLCSQSCMFVTGDCHSDLFWCSFSGHSAWVYGRLLIFCGSFFAHKSTFLSLGSECIVHADRSLGQDRGMCPGLGIHWLKESELLKGLRKIYIHPASHFSFRRELTSKPHREWFWWKKPGNCLWFEIEIPAV